MLTPILETKRIILRPLSVADAETIYHGWTSDPEVARYMRWNLHQSVQDTVEWLTLEESLNEKEGHYPWGFVLKETGELFGSGGLYYREEEKAYELGYNIMRKYWNQGLTTEASEAMLAFVRESLGAKSFFVSHSKENTASGRVIEKLGFVYRGEGECVSFDGLRRSVTREYVLMG